MAINLSQSQLRFVSTIGMGVLVGTSMIVIIPEGIETIYSAPKAVEHVHLTTMLTDTHTRRGETIYIRQTPSNNGKTPPSAREHSESEDGDEVDEEHDHHHHHHEETSPPHAWIGFALISGFVLMYLIDVLPSLSHKSSSEPYHIAIDNLRTMPVSAEDDSPHPNPPHSKPVSMTLGLVIHAAADGIALGASSASENLALGAIIFLAIMLHKAPAAFGLTAVLLRSGLPKRQVRTHLAVFSMAAPLGALATWFLIVVLGGDGLAGAGMQWWTGILLLFSGGTFLYVAMHTMQDQAVQLEESGQKIIAKDVIAAVFGMVLPLVMQIGHHHHH